MPRDGSVRTPVDFKLKSDWAFDTRRRTFESASGERFTPRGLLPGGSKIAHKVPDLARADIASLSDAERELRRYMHVILPRGESPERYLTEVRRWPPVEEAHVAPAVSLPQF